MIFASEQVLSIFRTAAFFRRNSSFGRMADRCAYPASWQRMTIACTGIAFCSYSGKGHIKDRHLSVCCTAAIICTADPRH